jgi:hypothetical protein
LLAARHATANAHGKGGTAIQIRKDVYNVQMSIRRAVLCWLAGWLLSGCLAVWQTRIRRPVTWERRSAPDAIVDASAAERREKPKEGGRREEGGRKKKGGE